MQRTVLFLLLLASTSATKRRRASASGKLGKGASKRTRLAKGLRARVGKKAESTKVRKESESDVYERYPNEANVEKAYARIVAALEEQSVEQNYTKATENIFREIKRINESDPILLKQMEHRPFAWELKNMPYRKRKKKPEDSIDGVLSMGDDGLDEYERKWTTVTSTDLSILQVPIEKRNNRTRRKMFSEWQKFENAQREFEKYTVLRIVNTNFTNQQTFPEHQRKKILELWSKARAQKKRANRTAYTYLKSDDVKAWLDVKTVIDTDTHPIYQDPNNIWIDPGDSPCPHMTPEEKRFNMLKIAQQGMKEGKKESFKDWWENEINGKMGEEKYPVEIKDLEELEDCRKYVANMMPENEEIPKAIGYIAETLKQELNDPQYKDLPEEYRKKVESFTRTARLAPPEPENKGYIDRIPKFMQNMHKFGKPEAEQLEDYEMGVSAQQNMAAEKADEEDEEEMESASSSSEEQGYNPDQIL